jgi:hypothetical protein
VIPVLLPPLNLTLYFVPFVYTQDQLSQPPDLLRFGKKMCVDKYFDELRAVIHKYNLQDKPHLIYNVDEKDIQANHKPPNVVDRSETVTLLGCGNAAGNAIPPYFKGP